MGVTQQQPAAIRQEPLKPEPITVYIQPQIGPGAIHFCLVCKQEFGQQEPWLKITRKDAGYSIGVHPGCWQQQSH